MFRIRPSISAAATALLLASAPGAATVRAQDSTAAPATPVAAAVAPDTVTAAARPRHLLRRGDMKLLAGAVAGSAVVSLFDARIARATQGAGMQGRPALRHAADVASEAGGAGPIALGVTLYAAGKIAGKPRLARFGGEVSTAVLGTGIFGYAMKGLVGRTRPMATDVDPDRYRPGRGFTDATLASFPSGHTTASFAVATVIASEMPRNRPRLRRAVTLLAYGGATMVGFSRVYKDQHWASDVLTGAAIGTVGGWMAVRRAHEPRSAVARVLAHASITVAP